MKLEEIQSLISTINQSNVEKLIFKNNDIELEIVNSNNKGNTKGVVQENQQPIEFKNNEMNTKEKINKDVVKSPLVGVYYSASGPNEEPFVTKGQQVKKGDVLCIVEAMKVMNEIVAKKDCTIRDILVSNEEIVEFDQDLFIIE